jgi:hypothetical protein
MVKNHNDDLAWIELMMLSKAVLRVPRERGGKKNKGKGEQDTKSRCKRWLDGDKNGLWKEALDASGGIKAPKQKTMPKKENKTPQASEAWDEQVMDLLRAGHLGKAAGAMISEPPVEVTPEVVAEMLEKHPAARKEELGEAKNLRQVDANTACRIDHLEILKIVKSFPKASAGGASELKPQHVLDAFVHQWQGEVGRNLAAVTNQLLKGDCPDSVRPWLAGAKLAALPKPTGGLRPIAVGETLRRIAAKAGMLCAADAVNERLRPFQVGVGVKSGAEVLVHTARQWLGRNREEQEKVFVMLDLKNAFNSIDRWAIRQGIRRTFPAAAPWIDFCYAGSTHIVLGDELLTSSRGVQQGDPAGPAIFALGIHEDVEEAKDEVEQAFPGELEWAGLFLDDTMAAGSARAVHAFVSALKTKWSKKGLEFMPAKCVVVPSAGNLTTVEKGMFDGMEWNEQGNFKLLGAPFGSKSECEGQMAKRVQKAELVAAGAAQLSSPQGGLLLVRYCGGFAKVAYVARTTPPHLVQDALRGFDGILRDHVGRVINCGLEHREWELAGISIKEGGIGLRHPEQHASAAYLASWFSARVKAKEVDPGFDPTDSMGGSFVGITMERFNGDVKEEDKVESDMVTDYGSQKNLSKRLDTKAKSRLETENLDDPYFRAHIKLAALPGAGAWLTAMPGEDEREVEPVLCRIAIKRRLRKRLFEEDHACTACGGVMDTWGDHALVCPCKGDRTRRHNILRDLLACEAARGGLCPEKEKAGLLPPRPVEDGVGSGNAPADEGDEARRPADIWLPRGAGFSGGKPEALDLAVTSGLRRDKINRTLANAEDICEDYTETKHNYKNTLQKVTNEGMQFTPLIFEAHAGGWGIATRQTIGTIAQHQEVCGVWYREGASLIIAQRVSIALQRETARAILRRMAPVCSDNPSCAADYTTDEEEDGWEQTAESTGADAEMGSDTW